MNVKFVTSPDNPLFRRVRKLLSTPTSYREYRQVWIEGEHLGRACVAQAMPVETAVVCESMWTQTAEAGWLHAVDSVVVVPDALFARVSALPSPAGVGLVMELPSALSMSATAPTVVLDRLQDAGNVGSILRSAAAMGVSQVVALPGTAGLWSPKVLRAGMGAQFGLRLIEGADRNMLGELQLPMIATSSHAVHEVWDAELPTPCNWAFGHEGQGLCAEVEALCSLTVRIPQPGGQESLNVAAAAAICLYEGMRRARHAGATPAEPRAAQ